MNRFYTLILISLALISWLHPVEAQDASTWMPDANLRAAVRKSLGLADNEDLTQAKLLDLTELKAAGRGISNLTGLEHATSVTVVRLAGNQISNISPLSGLTSVTKLRLQGNEITNITSLSGLTNLTELFLNDNQITDVAPLTSLVNLGTLRLTGNSLTNAHLLSSLTNLNSVDISIPDPPQDSSVKADPPPPETPADADPPSVSISVPSGVQNGAFAVTITFTETVSGFAGSDVSLTGSAASITAWSANSDNTVYTATITPTASGTVTIGVAADVATDTANNTNTAATSQSVTVDVDRPTVTIGVPSGTQTGAFNATITFSETVSGFAQSDVSLTGSAASITAWSANSSSTVYTATITPTASGTVTVGVNANVAIDAAGNNNTAATSKNVTVSVDTVSPGVSISVPSGVQNGAFAVTITFTETVSGFSQSDVSLTGSAASVTSWSANSDDTVYTATITPTASGTVTIGVGAHVATDGADNQNTAAASQSVTVDVNKPTVSISVPSGTQTGAFNATITFSEEVSGFTQSDVGLSGSAASITAWSGNSDNTIYTATITPTASGTVTVGVAANVATDGASNQNTAATSKTVSVDVDAPTVTIGVPSGTQNGAFSVTITFTETVSGFVQSDVSLSGSAASITSWSANGEATVYTATITPTVSGTVTIGVAANVATDAANNQNTAATSQTVTVSVDTESPGVSISVPSGIQNSAFDATITFTETVSGFTQSDVSLTGSAASITSWGANSNNTVYTGTITPTASGTVTIGVAANVATDGASNQNTAATSKTVSVDFDKPTAAIGVLSGTQTGAFNATITFSETVSGFTQSDVSLSGSAASITAWSANSDSTVYTATVKPTASGTVTIGVAANVATDAANNSNTAATSQTVIVDVDKPTATIGVPSGVQNGAFNVTITFTEAVSGFVQSDVTLSGSSASITEWNVDSDNTVYAAAITPTASGTVTVGVAANVATDAANNQNTAATSQTVTVDVDKPSVTIGVPSGTQTGAFNATITFSETVSGFTQSEVSLSGSAASITEWSANSDNTVYTAKITPTASGIVTVSVAADVATDTANNQNTAATPQSVTIAMPELVQELTTWMPDSNLRKAVRMALKLASDAIFSQEDMQSLTHLSVQIRIKDLTGLEHATQLTELNVRYSDIGDISPLAGLTSLTILDLRGNNISDVTLLAKLVNLEKLWLSENPITDISPLAGLTALRWLVIMSANVSDVTPLAKLVNLEQLLIAGNSISDFSPLSNLNNLQYADVEIPEPESLEVSISVPSDVQNGAFDATITFSEAVSDFVQADVSLGGSASSITSWSANSDNTVYTAAITPTASGTVTVGVAASVATDAANNPNTAATSQTVSVDVDKPTVTIGVPSGAQIGAFDAAIRFSERVSGFTQSEVSLAGSASSITSWSANSNNTIYTATITPTASGTATIGVAANVATDAANNSNTAATSQTVTIDVDKPTVTIGVPSGTQSSAFDTTITFSETVSGFTQSEVSLTGSTASITSWSANSDNTVYTVTITPTASGTVTIGVAANVASDAANNQNTAATSKNVTVDVDKPTVTIGVPSGVQNSAFNVSVTFTEAVSGFTQSDLSVGGTASASVTAWSGTRNTTYTATITPTSSGTVTLNVAAGVAADAANNSNTAATSQTVRIDVDAPSVSITVPTDDQTGAFDATIAFTEAVSNFEQSDVSVSGTAGSSITKWNTTDNITYTVTITPTTSGEVSVGVAATVATDAANNANTAATTQIVTVFIFQRSEQVVDTEFNFELAEEVVVVDTEPPGVSIGVPEAPQNGAFEATITFTVAVSGFVQSELSLTPNTAGATITAWVASSDNTAYTATITPTTSGTVTLNVAADVATDADSNPNTAATSQTVTVDVDKPTVNIGVPSGTQTGAFDATITFMETVSGFVGSDVSLTGSSASITSWSANSDDTVYTATITPTASGTMTIGVAANVATDDANNQNTAATSKTVTVSVDTTSPDVTVSVPSGVQNGAFNATITFTEPVSGFVRSEVSLSGSAASITSWRANSGNTVYTATITPTASGTVTIGVAANVATDAANNQNTASTSQTVTIDVDAPTVTIGAPSGTENGAFDATITFSETVSGFVQSDVSLSGSAASITAWNANTANTVYTATITPTASGTITVGVAANVATDAANNPNTAATSKTVTTLVVQLQQVDATSPGVTISVPSETQNGAFDVTITFTETVWGFVQSDVSLSGSAASITSWSANSDSTVYTATITPTASGTVTIGVAANVANNAEGNPNLVATPQTVSIDVDSLGVSISVNSYNTSGYGASISPVVDAIPLVMVTFTEPVKRDEFDPRSALTFSGATVTINIAAPMSDRCSEVTVDKQTIRLCSQWLYDLTVTESGELTFNIAAGVAQDLAGNSNTRATALTVTADIDRPEISRVTVPSGPQTGEFNMTIEFTEPVSPGSTTVLSGYLSASSSDLTISRSPAGLSYSATFTDERVDRTTYILTLRPDDGRWSMDGKIRIAAISSDTVKDAARNLNLQQSLSESVSPYVSVFRYSPYDLDKDDDVDIDDAKIVVQAIGQSGNDITDPRTDINGDGTVNNDDLLLVIDNYGEVWSEAPASGETFTLLDKETLETLAPAALEAQLEILRVESDGSLKYQRAIALLEGVLASLRPHETQLLANYPNPFNPETWIPYQLADTSKVSIAIYNIRGAVIRRLELGHQQAGYYTSRSRAAYWDGRNGSGEQVASGVYFFTLAADTFRATRKMLVGK